MLLAAQSHRSFSRYTSWCHTVSRINQHLIIPSIYFFLSSFKLPVMENLVWINQKSIISGCGLTEFYCNSFHYSSLCNTSITETPDTTPPVYKVLLHNEWFCIIFLWTSLFVTYMSSISSFFASATRFYMPLVTSSSSPTLSRPRIHSTIK